MTYIVLEAEQGSDEWFDVRRGVVTASECSKILSPTGKVSTQSSSLLYKLAAEAVANESVLIQQNEWMLRGTEMESEAREWFEFHSGLSVNQVGFIKSNSMNIGCSPDGLISESCGLEIKCPAPHTHAKYLIENRLPNDYIPQVQFSMLVTGFEMWHFVSYHPLMKKLHIEVKRDEDWISKMLEELSKFLPNLEKTITLIKDCSK